MKAEWGESGGEWGEARQSAGKIHLEGPPVQAAPENDNSRDRPGLDKAHIALEGQEQLFLLQQIAQLV